MVLQARALEFYGQLGLADAIVERGIRVETAHFREHGQEMATLPLRDVGAGTSPYLAVLPSRRRTFQRLMNGWAFRTHRTGACRRLVLT